MTVLFQKNIIRKPIDVSKLIKRIELELLTCLSVEVNAFSGSGGEGGGQPSVIHNHIKLD